MPSTRSRLLDLFKANQNLTIKDACESLGVSRQRVHKIASEEGIRLKPSWNYRIMPGAVPARSPVPEHHDATGTRLSPHVASGINEMRVAMYFLERGFDVYRSVTAYGMCDLMAMNRETGAVLRVEVKSAWRTESGRSISGGSKNNRYDVLARVFRDGSIELTPTV